MSGWSSGHRRTAMQWRLAPAERPCRAATAGSRSSPRDAPPVSATRSHLPAELLLDEPSGEIKPNTSASRNEPCAKDSRTTGLLAEPHKDEPIAEFLPATREGRV